MDLRCDSGILHARLLPGAVLEVACKSRRCGKKPGNVVLHEYSFETGELLRTRVFQQPKEVNSNGNRSEQGSALRIA